MNSTTSATTGPVAGTFRSAPHQRDAVQDDTVTTLILEVPVSVTEERLADAIRTVSLRHEALRTVLTPSPAGGPPTLSVHEESLPADGGRPWSATLVSDEHLRLSAPAQCMDPAGLLILGGELERELRSGAAGPEQGEVLQYADVAAWLHEVLDDAEAALAGENQRTAHGEAGETEEALARLRSLGRAETAARDREDGGPGPEASPTRWTGLSGPDTDAEALLLTAWLVVLHRYCGVRAPVLRVSTGLREIPQLADVLGPLSSWPGFRHDFDAAQTLGEAAETVRTARAAQRENAELLGGLSAVTGPLGFSYVQLPAHVGSWSVDSLTTRGTGPGIRLVAVRHEYLVGLSLDGTHAAELGEELTARLLEATAAVVEQIRRAPGTRIGQVALGEPSASPFTPATPTALAWQDDTLPGLVVQAAARTPDAVAVRSGNSRLTYRRLVSAADRLAAELGTGPEHVVAVLVPDPVDRLVAQLAVLRAGSAYLVLDPEDPADRLGAFLDDASARVCVVTEETGARLGGVEGHRLVPVPDSRAREETDTEPPPEAAEPSGLGPENLAYLLFTSGSTGRPKPVAVTHANVVNYLGWLVDTGLVGPDTVLPATAAPIFDASLKQLWGPLVVGGTVVLPPLGERPAETLAAAVSAAGTDVTAVNTVPRLWDETLRTLEASPTAGAARDRPLDVLLGGEALTSDLAERTRRLLPKARLWNLYGPSETTANATAGIVTDGTGINLGRPVGGTTAHVLDEAMAPVPPGVIGELYVGGAGVGRGYADRGALTAERFVPDPFSASPGTRLYRTGDLVRLGVNGLLEFCGRADSQLKVRGYRVEPGEIESVLLDHDQVSAVVVGVRDDRLVAWLVPGQDGPPTVEALRTHCGLVLPPYLVPAVFVALDRIPSTAHGKTDRRALPDPADGHLGQTGAFVPPRDAVEMVVAEIWRTVLKTDRVGAHDNFFVLGGDSIRAMHVVARVRELMGAELPLHGVLGAPTVADLAELLVAHDHDGAVKEFAAAFAELDTEPGPDSPAPTGPVGPAFDVMGEER
ncbi:amino acid adenylation domain-containing protein [Streptomyces sp. NPDC091406]|uniref:non-ribosomal peptide synthetase n=1 Tax=unclassified Streptomyces TaxID=2593676 RepID=UPI003803DBC2